MRRVLCQLAPKFSSVVFAASPLWSNVTATKQQIEIADGGNHRRVMASARFIVGETRTFRSRRVVGALSILGKYYPKQLHEDNGCEESRARHH
jgi:hypothetical protein